MSVRVTGSGYARRDISAATISETAAFTFCVWSKRFSALNFAMHGGIHNSTSSTASSIWRNQSGTGNNLQGTQNGSGTGVTTGVITTGTWFFSGIRSDGTNLDQFYALLGDVSLTVNNSVVGIGANSAANFITLGAYYNGTLGADAEFAQFRIWTGAAAAKLTDAQLLTERDNSAEQLLTNLYLSWPMTNSTDTGDHSGNSRIWTAGGSGLVDGASDPANGAVNPFTFGQSSL